MNMQKVITADSNEEIVTEDLDMEILEAIGSRMVEESFKSSHSKERGRWIRLEDILKKDQPKEKREKLIKNHIPPKNSS